MSTNRTAGRTIRAVAPRPQAEALRAAYLELLKLSLCDLAGVGTESVQRTFHKEPRIYSQELPADKMHYRVSGRDWPLNALTMAGLMRLDDLQLCVESVVGDDIEGDLIEAGTWRGGASILMRATLDSLGADERTVWLADSFEGFPEADPDAFPEDADGDDLSGLSFLAAPLEQVRGHFGRFGFERGVRFVPGFFSETMPSLRGGRWSVVRIDGDTYESTWLTLESLYPGLSTGGYLIIDDYQFVAECRRAVDQFRLEREIAEPLEPVDWSCVRWRRESEPGPASTRPPGRRQVVRRKAAARSVAVQTEARIPSWHELELESQLAELRERLRAAESEIEQLRRLTKA
jgi:O-methyltransferase